MSRARLSLSVDDDNRIMILRYLGDMEGSEINLSMMDHLSRLAEPWTYDSVIDMRRFDGMVTATEIEELGLRWGMLAQGRDKGRLTAVVSVDAMVHARRSMTQAAFPFRELAYFNTFDEGLEWIDSQRGQKRRDVA